MSTWRIVLALAGATLFVASAFLDWLGSGPLAPDGTDVPIQFL